MNKLLIGFIGILSCFQLMAHTNEAFQGTWILVSGEYVNHEGKLVSYEELGITSQKIIADGHFSFVSMSNNSFWAAGTGTFTIENNQYIENLQMASFAVENNGNYPFTFSLIGDTWKNERWKDGKRVEFEVWQRVK